MNHLPLFLVLLLSISPSLADNVYVSTTPGDNPDGTQNNPYGSFSAAVDSPGLKSGTHIKAYPGTYKGDDNYNLVIDPSLSLAFVVEGTGEVAIDFEGTNNGFLTVTSNTLPFAIEGYKFQNQKQNDDTPTPVLSFTGTDDTLISACIFENVGFALSMIEVTEMIIDGGSFDACVSQDQNGPALFCQDSLGTITSTVFQNSHGSKGGAVFIDGTPNGFVTMESVQILNNKAEKYGGGLYVNQHANVTITNSAIRNNEALDHSGGGVYSEAPITIKGTDIEYNTAAEWGGGMALETFPSTSSYVAHSTQLASLGVNGNIAQLGAGIHLSSLSPVFISSSSFDRNTAQSDDTDDGNQGMGGALYVNTSSDTVTIDDSTIGYNHADEKGGGVYIAGPSGSSLVQLRAGCVVENNYAATSGGGVELAGPILFASFTSSTFINNVVGSNSGTGGALQLGGSSIVSQCTIHSNSAHDGGGLHIFQAGIVSVVDSSIAINNASYGGGLHVSAGSGVIVKGGDISDNTALQGGGVYIAPSLPVEFSDVLFQTNTVGQAGSSIYLSGVSQSTINGLNLVKVKDCEFLDDFTEAIYSNGGEIVFSGTCSIPGIQTVSESSVSVCGCSESAIITNLLLQASSGNFLSDNNVQVTGNFAWYGGDLYGVNSTTCVNGLKTGFNYSSETDITLSIYGSGIAASDETLSSTDVDWFIAKDASLNMAAFEMDIGIDNSITIENKARFTMPQGVTVRCGYMYNQGTLQMEKLCTIDGDVIQSGTLSLHYTSPQGDKKDLAYIKSENIDSGATCFATVPASPKLEEGDEFYLLKWGVNEGHFSSFELKSELADKTHGVLFYKENTLECVIEHGSNGSGGLIAVIIVSVVVVLAFVIGAWWAIHNKDRWGGEGDEVWDDGASQEQRVLGESGQLVEGREEQSLINNNDL